MQSKFPNTIYTPVLKLMFFHLLFCKLHSHSERGWITEGALVCNLSSVRSHKPFKWCMKSLCKAVVYSTQVCTVWCNALILHFWFVFRFGVPCLLYEIMYTRKYVCALETPKQLCFIIREVWGLLLLLKNFKLSRSSFHPAQTVLWLITFCPIASLQSPEKIFLLWFLLIPLPFSAIRYLFREKTHWSTTCNDEFTGDCEGITHFMFTPLHIMQQYTNRIKWIW